MELGDLTLGDGEQADAGEAQPLEQSGDVFLIARQPVERLGQNDVEQAAPGISQEPLIRRPYSARPAAGAIYVDIEIRPTLRPDRLPAKPDLALDRGSALHVARVSGIDGGSHQRMSSASSSNPTGIVPSRIPMTRFWCQRIASIERAWL